MTPAQATEASGILKTIAKKFEVFHAGAMWNRRQGGIDARNGYLDAPLSCIKLSNFPRTYFMHEHR